MLKVLRIFWVQNTRNMDAGDVTKSFFVTNITLILNWYRWNKFVFSKYGMTDEGFEVAWRLRRA